MKLSIIIPTLNEEKILERTLKTLRQLTAFDYEIIVSDGGSADQTLTIAKNLADKIVLAKPNHRQTIGEGKNLGAALASGDYLVFIDADVIIPRINQFFKTALDFFDRDPKLKGLTVFLKVLPENITISDRLFFTIVNRLYQFSNNVLHQGSASGEFQMLTKATFEQLGGYNQTLTVGEDQDFFGRLSKIGKTKVASDLYIMHTSRRAHALGWTNLLLSWIGNFFYTKMFKRSFSKEWKVIR